MSHRACKYGPFFVTPGVESQVGYLMLKTGTLNTLELMSKEEGKHMDNPESIKVRLLRCLACALPLKWAAMVGRHYAVPSLACPGA